MRIRIRPHTVVSLAFSVATLMVFLFFSLFFREQLILYLGVPFALGAFFLSSMILGKNGNKVSIVLPALSRFKIFLFGLAIFSAFAVLFIPAFDGSMLEWMKISPLNWLRYFSSLLLTSFLPGYLLLKIVDRKDEVSGCIVIVFSYLLSLFISFVVGFFILLSANSMSSLGLPVIIAINLTLIVIYYFMNRINATNRLLTLNLFEFGLILSTFIVVMVGSIAVMINNMPLTFGDMWQHNGFALQYFKGFPVYRGRLITYSGGYLFHIYLAVVFTLSGIPSALAEQGLYILSFMPVLAFYYTVRTWFSWNEEKLPVIATFLSILLGFGGLYALRLRFMEPACNIINLLNTATSKTYDIYMRILYLPDIVAPIWNIGLPVFLCLLYFLKKESCPLAKAIIIPILVVLGYLAHVSEIVFFTGILFIYVLFLKRGNEAKIGPYIVLGLAAVAMVDFIAPAHVYVLSRAGTNLSLPFFVNLILATLTSVVELVKDRYAFRFSMNLRHSFLEKLGKSWTYGRWILLYVYVFFFIVWLTIVDDFNLWAWGGYAFTPFFVLPLRLGPVGLLAILSIIAYFKGIRQNRSLLFFLLLIPIGFLGEQVANYYLLDYPAYRYGTLTFIGACVIAAYGFKKVIEEIRQSLKRKIIASVFLGFLVISGMLSTSLYYVNASYYSLNSQITQNELDALDYIQHNTPTNASVLTFTSKSANNLRNFAGLNAVQDAQRWSKLLLSTSNPYVITYILGSSNVKYIYLSQEDMKLLGSNNVLKSFIEHFRKVFENDYVTVYEVPPLIPPSPNAPLGVIHFSPLIQKPKEESWFEDSFAEGWHSYRQYGKVEHYESKVENGIMEISQWTFTEDDVFPALFAASLQSRYSFTYVDSIILMKNINAYISRYTHILLTSDPPVPIGGLLNWVSAGGNLIVLNTNGKGFFSGLLGINNSSPFLLTSNLGLGKVLYINLGVDEKSELLKPELIEKIKEDLALDKYVHKVDVLPVYNSTSGSIEIDGGLNFSTDVLKLQACAINLTGVPFQLNGSAEIWIYGRVTLTINDASLVISPSESYLMVKPEGYPVEGEVFVDGNNSLIIIADTNATYIFNTPIRFTFKAVGASIQARLPSINASGIIVFDQLDVHEALYVPLAGIVQQKAEVKGDVKFSTRYISNPLIIFSTFQAEGKILNLAEKTPGPGGSIPWFEVLTSPYNIIFNAIFLFGITIYAFKIKIRRRS